MFRLKDKLRFIFNATKQHAKNLGMFVTIYKTLLLVQKHMNGGKEQDIHSFFAGIVGGYYVFGTNNNINQQVWDQRAQSWVCMCLSIVIYVSSPRLSYTFSHVFSSVWPRLLLSARSLMHHNIHGRCLLR
jgi:Tim17/Tim22/Tim23/Pmp24 family